METMPTIFSVDGKNLIPNVDTESENCDSCLNSASKSTFHKLKCQEFLTHLVIWTNLPLQGSYLKYQIENISPTSVEGIITKSSEEVNHIWPAMLLLKPQMH